jgi:hypothetical protein
MDLDSIPDVPPRIRALPRDHRGYPVPWFVAWVDGEPLFPCIETTKVTRAWREQRCWVCGELLGRWKASVIGPMCAITRTISEPQSHVDCARFSALHCPFLSRPQMKRVPLKKIPDSAAAPAGVGIARNPGATLVWIETARTEPFRAAGGYLFHLGEPDSVEWYARGRRATRAEVIRSIDTGLPLLVDQCNAEPPGAPRGAALAELAKRRVAVDRLLPA